MALLTYLFCSWFTDNFVLGKWWQRLSWGRFAAKHPFICGLVVTVPHAPPPSSGFALVFVFCVILSAFDFWTVKNVTGRLLVGLRWWNEVKEDGENVWIFESQPDGFRVHPTDKLVFWAGLYLNPLVGSASVVFSSMRANGSTLFGFLNLATHAHARTQIWIILAIVALVKFQPKWLLVGEFRSC